MTSLELDDPDLPRLLRQRDAESLRRVIHAYLPQILRTARSSGLKESEAEDVAQETFATFLSTVERFEGRSHVRTWIFGIFYRKLAESRRGFAKDSRFDDIDDVFESRFDDTGSWTRPPSPADAKLLRRQVQAGIEACLETAPERQRLAFHLREVEQVETEEICKILDVTVTNLNVMLFRVRNRLRECLEERGFEGAVDAKL